MKRKFGGLVCSVVKILELGICSIGMKVDAHRREQLVLKQGKLEAIGMLRVATF